MALDQIPNSWKRVRSNIVRNIGNSFARLGQFADAVQSYETIMGGDPDSQTGFNLILCYYALGNAEKMRRGFQKLLTVPACYAYEQSHERVSGMKSATQSLSSRHAVHDQVESVTGGRTVALDEWHHDARRRERELHDLILIAARLIAPHLRAPSDPMFGFKWIIETLKGEHEMLASEIELERALCFLHTSSFNKAVDCLKAYERKDERMKAMAATNLSFIYLLEDDVKTAERYADLAYCDDRYNAKALVNKGNCLVKRLELELARQYYLEAIGVEADCVEAIYNLGLVNFMLGCRQEAIQAFEKVHQIVPSNAEVIHQIANLHEENGHADEALKWYNILVTRAPCDSRILLQIAHMLSCTDESQAAHFHLEAYRLYPVSLDVVSWLGVWYVKLEMYEKAIHFFERASQIQPNEPKWQLMVTSCYRRMGSYREAKELYEYIHSEHPENTECLRYLVAICKDLGLIHEQYQDKLSRLKANLSFDESIANKASIQVRKEGSARPVLTQGEQEAIVEKKVMLSTDAEPVSDHYTDHGKTEVIVDFDDTDVHGLLPGC
mmetsp:Transcript_16978/g.53007  ORF Transcript_16978/g.53007 Transcript_16978/m.53007 type:complete len:554 (+) Transcript_16978:886-2547(+)